LSLVKFELNIATITLLIIGIPILIEIFVANSPSLKKYFSNEEKAKNFLIKINSMTHEQIQENINTINFSSENMGLLLKHIFQNQEKIPVYIIKDIIDYNELTINHINLVFSEENLQIYNDEDEDFIINLLLRFRGKLNKENIRNIYTVFKTKEGIIKVLIATQPESAVLIRETNDKRITSLYESYHQTMVHEDILLKIISIDGINRFQTLSIGAILCVGFLYAIQLLNFPLSRLNDPSTIPLSFLFSFFLIPFFLSFIINGFLLTPLFKRLKKWHRAYFKEQVLRVVY
jgi:hypothetical protein